MIGHTNRQTKITCKEITYKNFCSESHKTVEKEDYIYEILWSFDFVLMSYISFAISFNQFFNESVKTATVFKFNVHWINH